MGQKIPPQGQMGLPGWNTERLQKQEQGSRALLRENMSSYLTTPECLSELLSVGLERAQEISSRMGLREMSRLGQPELERALGLTTAQSCRLAAALTLAWRLEAQVHDAHLNRRDLGTPEDVVNYIAPKLAGLEQEELHGLYLNTKNRLEVHRMIYRGNVNSAIVRPSEVLKPAVACNLPSVIIVHNHPSGDPTPSPEDISITRDIAQSGKLLGITVLDHVVVGNQHRGGFVSMKEQRLMEFPAG